MQRERYRGNRPIGPSEGRQSFRTGYGAVKGRNDALPPTAHRVSKSRQFSTRFGSGELSEKAGMATSKLWPSSPTMRYSPTITPLGVVSGQPEA